MRPKRRVNRSTPPPPPSDLEVESDDPDDTLGLDDSPMEEPRPGPSAGPPQ